MENMKTELRAVLQERLSLAKERLLTLEKDAEQIAAVDQAMADFCKMEAKWLVEMITVYERVENQEFTPKACEKRSIQELLEENRGFYQEILPENYEQSFCNPAYAKLRLGEEYGAQITFLAAELRSLLSFAFEQKLEQFVIRIELFLEVYGAITNGVVEQKKIPAAEEIYEIIYWFVSDYSETERYEKVKELVDPRDNFFVNLMENADLSNPNYLFGYGEYITEDEIRLARFMASLSEERIALMADTYTEGYRIGFEVGNKDLSKKKTVNVRYVAGFERMIKKAIENFRKMGLEPTIYRAPVSVMNGRSVAKSGFFGNIANKQYEYDHKDDLALVYDRKLVGRFYEENKAALEAQKEWAYVHAGPAVLETFGEVPFSPVPKKENIHFSAEQQKLKVEHMNQMQVLTNQYIKGEERSFTIIAFPVPQIGEKFEEIFDEIITVNTLDYQKYQKIQSDIIEVLNECVAVEVKGMNGNKTDLHVSLYPLSDSSKEAIFENCVADVNIPVGEVFTSPVLKGTEGLLHVSEVFLNELKYEDLSIWFQDGMITGYDCGNFMDPKENRDYIKENVLYAHDTLPIGEFAIGTNTTAYMVGRKYQIQDKLPILIAEKTGPHFAVGDTCYSHSEDVRVYNPDGKEIVAKDNEVSVLRKSEPEKAYLNCHTDITIPYDELGALYGIRQDGSRVDIILEGKFVLPGTEELNVPFTK